MTVKILDTKIVWGRTFPELMNGVAAMKADGWKPLGMPTPMVLDNENNYGMMHMIYKDRSKD